MNETFNRYDKIEWPAKRINKETGQPFISTGVFGRYNSDGTADVHMGTIVVTLDADRLKLVKRVSE